MTTMSGRLVKQDSRGRVLVPDSQREALLDAYEASGLSGPQFCTQHGVKYPTFATWMQRRRRERGEIPERSSFIAADALSLILAEVELPDLSTPEAPSGTPRPLEVALPGGTRLTIHCKEHAAWAALFVNSVAGGAGC
jgi:hypothetical protein